MAYRSRVCVRCISFLAVASVLCASHGLPSKDATDISHISEQFRAYDENGQGRKVWLANYQNAKSHCAWEQDIESLEFLYDWFPTDKIMRASYWSYLASQLAITTYYPAVPRWLVRLFRYLVGPVPRGQGLESYHCHVADSEGTEYQIRRFGPFVGNGGFDWHKMKLEDPYNLRSHVEQQGIHVTGFAAMPVDEDGKILGNPPIHIHHANLGPNRGSSLSRLSQWHGDSQCSEKNGGTACYATALPSGFGFPVSEGLRLDIDFNDVRPLESPDLKFWLETSISIARPSEENKVQDIGTVILGVPFRGQWWKTSDFQRLYFVPTDQPSALWVTGRMPTSGTFVAGGKLEIHQHMLDEAWVFTGVSPEDLGLNSEMWQLQEPWLPWIPMENGLTNSSEAMATLKTRVLGHFEKAVQRCKEDLACNKPPTHMWTLNRTIFEEGEDRQMPWPENTWSFEQEDQFTTVIFHKAIGTHGMHGDSHTTEMAQHLAITGYYIPKAGAPAEYWFVMPSSNADWAWINSVNWFHALTHFGGPPAGFGISQSIAVIAIISVCLTLFTCVSMKCINKVTAVNLWKEHIHGRCQWYHGKLGDLAVQRHIECDIDNTSDEEHPLQAQVHDSESCVSGLV